MNDPIEIYVELIDEGVPGTLRPTYAVASENNLYKLLPSDDYTPETDEAWAFAPGNVVRLVEEVRRGEKLLVARHPDLTAVQINVESEEKQAPTWRETYALPLNNGLYKVLPTPHYTPEQLWKFPPGSVVRLEKQETMVGSSHYTWFRAVDA